MGIGGRRWNSGARVAARLRALPLLAAPLAGAALALASASCAPPPLEAQSGGEVVQALPEPSGERESARRRAWEDCWRWADAFSRSARREESDRDLDRVAGGGIAQRGGAAPSVSAGLREERLRRLVGECVDRFDAAAGDDGQ